MHWLIVAALVALAVKKSEDRKTGRQDIDARLAELEAARKDATNAGDVAEADDLKKEIADLREQLREVKGSVSGREAQKRAAKAKRTRKPKEQGSTDDADDSGDDGGDNAADNKPSGEE